MRYIILSDTHGNKKGVEKLLQTVEHDGVIFAGDGESDFSNVNGNITMVKGNCDFFSKLPQSVVTKINGTKVLITHGNMYGVKSGLGSLIAYAESEEVQLVIYGHNHKQSLEKINGITYLNPGTFKKSSTLKSSYAIIDFKDNNFFINMTEF